MMASTQQNNGTAISNSKQQWQQGTSGISASEAAAQAPAVMSPQAPISECPGRLLPMYRFAAPTPTASVGSKRRVPRNTSTDLLVMVPDTDRDGGLMSHTPLGSTNDLLLLAPSSPDDSSDYPSLGMVPSRRSSAPMPAAGSAKASYPASDSDADGSEEEMSRDEGRDSGLLDMALTALWDDAAARGLFRYDLSTTSTKKVEGHLRFVAQLNEGRANKKRPTEFRTDAVVQPFDERKFNFKKAAVQEVLFQFEPSTAARSTLEDASECNDSPNLVVINVSPIEYGHVLLVPRVMDGLPQLVDPSTLDLALAFAAEAGNSKLRVGYNSLGAYATINHLHYQAYYLDAPFPCELAPTEALPGLKRRRDGISIRRLVRYPVNAFVVEMEPSISAASTPEELAALRSEVASLVGTACMRLAAINQPHNLLICDEGRRVFLFPQGFAARLAEGSVPDDVIDTGINPACFEIAGHMLLKRQQDYDTMGEADMARLLSFASLPEDRFLQLAQLCFGPQQDGKQDKNSTPIFLY